MRGRRPGSFPLSSRGHLRALAPEGVSAGTPPWPAVRPAASGLEGSRRRACAGAPGATRCSAVQKQRAAAGVAAGSVGVAGSAGGSRDETGGRLSGRAPPLGVPRVHLACRLQRGARITSAGRRIGARCLAVPGGAWTPADALDDRSTPSASRSSRVTLSDCTPPLSPAPAGRLPVRMRFSWRASSLFLALCPMRPSNRRLPESWVPFPWLARLASRHEASPHPLCPLLLGRPDVAVRRCVRPPLISTSSQLVARVRALCRLLSTATLISRPPNGPSQTPGKRPRVIWSWPAWLLVACKPVLAAAAHAGPRITLQSVQPELSAPHRCPRLASSSPERRASGSAHCVETAAALHVPAVVVCARTQLPTAAVERRHLACDGAAPFARILAQRRFPRQDRPRPRSSLTPAPVWLSKRSNLHLTGLHDADSDDQAAQFRRRPAHVPSRSRGRKKKLTIFPGTSQLSRRCRIGAHPDSPVPPPYISARCWFGSPRTRSGRERFA